MFECLHYMLLCGYLFLSIRDMRLSRDIQRLPRLGTCKHLCIFMHGVVRVKLFLFTCHAHALLGLNALFLFVSIFPLSTDHSCIHMVTYGHTITTLTALFLFLSSFPFFGDHSCILGPVFSHQYGSTFLGT
jgi:hypothetical protein